MRLLSIILFQFIATTVYGQITVDLYFNSDCDNSINRLEFDLLNLNDTTDNIQSKNGIAIVPTKGKYLLTSQHDWADDRIGLFSQVIIVTDPIKQTDTLNIPKIKFTWDGVLHGTGYWNYFKCGKLCKGIEIDFYPNGQKRTEGEFKEGKPVHMVEYRQNGTRDSEFWYVVGTQFYKRANYFDESGILKEYEIYKKKSKRKTVVTTFTASGQKIESAVIRYTVVK